MAIFGKILYLPYSSGTIVFIDVLVVFTIFEGCKFESVFETHHPLGGGINTL